jgi:hypothetical protein
MISEDELSEITESEDQNQIKYDSENTESKERKEIKKSAYKYPSTNTVFKLKEDILDYF